MEVGHCVKAQRRRRCARRVQALQRAVCQADLVDVSETSVAWSTRRRRPTRWIGSRERCRRHIV